jgi:hypothetical protein
LVQMLLFNSEANIAVASAGFSRSMGPGPMVATLGLLGILITAWSTYSSRAPLRAGPV